ncbi:transporter substrate-binding domain-containing protein [Zavarzinia sp. CC-PAN008]|uniref:transporter substrate-binding domain-containing protein n=1 Tax=Zavarzinia sp. CC-PAN008 TaxID=3243332 RepID=UPI003F743EC9
MIRRVVGAALCAGVVALGVMGSVAGAASAGEVLDRILARKELVNATPKGFAPASYTEPTGDSAGFDLDVAREIAKRMGVALKTVEPTFEDVVAGNWGDAFDIAVASVSPTEDRLKVLDLSAIYYFEGADIAVREQDMENFLPSQLDGKVIGTCAGCTYEGYLKRDLKLAGPAVPPFSYRIKPGEIVTFPSIPDALAELAKPEGSRIVAVMGGLPKISRAMKEGLPIRMMGDPVFFAPMAVAVGKGDPELAARVNQIVADMHKDGTLSRLSERWFGSDLTKVD